MTNDQAEMTNKKSGRAGFLGNGTRMRRLQRRFFDRIYRINGMFGKMIGEPIAMLNSILFIL
jgi:hypothetical protein